MNKQKKLRAAIAGIIMFLEQEENDKSKKQNKNIWARYGRQTIMHNRGITQRRRKTFGIGRS